MNKQTPMEEMRLRKKYSDEFFPLINEKKYGEAFEFLLHNKSIKGYLKPSDMLSMYDFLESMCFDLAIMINEPNMTMSKIKNKLKGLEGKTEPRTDIGGSY